MSILIVGPTERTSNILSLLRDINIGECTKINDGSEAFGKLLEDDSIDLVITEWNTVSYKTTLTKRMKRSFDERVKKIPVICLASSKLANNLKVEDTNGDVLLFSPFTHSQLKEKIESFSR